MEHLIICELCKKPNELRFSHIIPKSFYRHAKSEGDKSQLAIVREGETKALVSNSDPKERLLCQSCESHLARKFEQRGTRLLLNTNKIKKISASSLLFKSYKYKSLYLFYISILWRVSISKMYDHINLHGFNEVFRKCINSNTLIIKDNVRLDQFVRVSLFKITDKSGVLSRNCLSRIILQPNIERPELNKDGMIYYMMLHGFLIVYRLFDQQNLSLELTGQLSSRGTTIIPIKDISDFKFLTDIINTAVDMRAN